MQQWFDLHWYWEKHNYYLQIIAGQYQETNIYSSSYAWVGMKIGSGIRLYNDNDNHYIKYHNGTIEKVFYNSNDNTFCHSTGKKIGFVAASTSGGAIAGSIVPGIGTLIGAAIGGLFGGVASVFITEEACNNKIKRNIIDINKFEEKNITKWTNEFTKSINHEQHLPIDNKSNFSTSNITSL